jgi:hypothetical protein
VKVYFEYDGVMVRGKGWEEFGFGGCTMVGKCDIEDTRIRIIWKVSWLTRVVNSDRMVKAI